MFLIFLKCVKKLKCVKITSVGQKLDRAQLQHWLLFLEYNRPRSENSYVVDLYLWAMTGFVVQLASPLVILILSGAGSSSSFSRV